MRPSFVHSRTRARLFDLWTFLLLVALLASALVLVFPRELSLRATDYIEQPTAVSLAYLQALVRAHPEDAELRLQLARQYRATGHFAEADRTLRPLLADDGPVGAAMARRIQWLKARIDRDRLYSLPAGSERRRLLRQGLADRLAVLAAYDDAAPGDLQWLAETALGLQQPGLAAQLFHRLADMPGEDRWRRLMQAAEWYAGAGRYGDAVDAYRAAMDAAVEGNGPVAARALVETWLAAGRPERAWRAGESLLQRYPGDEGLLRLAERAALAAGETAAALAFAQQRWPARTEMDTQGLRDRLALELAASRLNEAAASAGVLHERMPSDASVRLQLARLLEWTGRPEASLDHWLWLTRQQPAVGRDPPVWQLALDLYEFRVAQDLLLENLKRRPLRRAELDGLAWATGQGGSPERVIAALQQGLDRGGLDAAHWRYLLDLLRDTGRREQWLQIAARYAPRFPVDTPLRVEWARQYMAQGDWERALALLQDGAPPRGEAAAAYWQAVATAALNLQDFERALAAYQALAADARNLQGAAAERFLALSLFLERYDSAFELADRRWRETGEPFYLLAALRSAQALGRHDYIRATTEPPPRAVARSVDYWQWLAGYHQGRGNMQRAGEALRRALVLAPRRSELRAAYLWYLIDAGRQQALARRVEAWSTPDAGGELAAALASANQALGRYREAVGWYRREASSRPREWLWLLGYADALEGAGYQPAAYRLRRYVFGALLGQADGGSTDLAQARARLHRRFQGAPAGYQALPAGRLPGPWYPLLMDWQLESGLGDAARHTLRRAHLARLELPAWQQLSVALAENDRSAIEALLAGDGTLTEQDRAVAEQRLNRHAQALARSQAAVDSSTAEAASAASRQQAVALSSLLAPGVRAGASHATGDGIDVWRAHGEVRQPVGESVVLAEVQTQRSRSQSFFTEGAVEARRLALGWDDVRFGGFWRVQAGAESREGRTRPLGRAELSRELDAATGIGLGLHWNDAPQASMALDALTAYQGVSASWQWRLTPRTAVSARGRYGRFVDWWQGGTVARGGDGGLVLTELIWAEPVRWQLRLGGGWQSYRREDELSRRFGGRLETDVDGDALLLEDSTSWRLGSRWQHGEPGRLSGRATWPRWAVDVSAGWQTPGAELLLGAEAAVGWPVLGGDELAVEMDYSDNARADGASEISAGMTYTYWFGR